MLTDYLLEIDELKKTIKKYEDVLLKKTYRESHLSKKIEKLEKENEKLKEENVLLKWCLDEMMFKADVVNVKINWELWDYCYVRSDKRFKLNVKD